MLKRLKHSTKETKLGIGLDHISDHLEAVDQVQDGSQLEFALLDNSANDQDSLSVQISQYVDYMRNEKGLSEVTISDRIYRLNDFFNHVKQKKITLHNFTPIQIDKILSSKRDVDGYSRLSLRSYASVIRTFLRYAWERGWCQKKLADSIKSIRVYKHETLPYAPSWDEVKRLLATTEGNSPINIRDRAILMLLAMYGLRRAK